MHAYEYFPRIAFPEDSDVVWVCSGCGELNYSSSLFSSFHASTTNSFRALSSISSEDDIMSPNGGILSQNNIKYKKYPYW
jgi:hypothetical protein